MEKKIEFTGVDNGLSSMIKKLRDETKQLGSDLISEARSYSQSSREQVSYINEQIRAIEQRNRLELESNKIIAQRQYEMRSQSATTQAGRDEAKSDYESNLATIMEGARNERMQVDLLRELIDTVKANASQEIAENRAGVERRVQEFQRTGMAGSPEEALKLGMQGQMLGMGGMSTASVFSGMVGANLLKELGSILGSFPGAKSQLDLISPATQLMGAGLGGTAGTGMDMLMSGRSILGTTLTGETDMGVVGMEVGRQVGSMIGSGLQRVFETRFELEMSQLGMRAMSGADILSGTGRRGFNRFNQNAFRSGGVGINMEDFGFDMIETSKMMRSVMEAQGTAAGAGTGAREMALLMKGFGLDEQTVLGQFSQSRITGQRNVLDNLTGMFEELVNNGVMSPDDRVLFGEFIRNANELVGVIGQTSEDVDPKRMSAILQMFDSMGGIFSLKDPRSLQNIMSINQSLSSPQNDFVQAANFQALRRLKPEAGLFDLMRMQQEGLNTPGFLNQVIGDIVRYGGNEDTQKVMLSQRFPGLGLDAVERLFKRYQETGNITTEFLDEVKGDTGFTVDPVTEARKNLSNLEKSMAEINNAFIEGFYESIATVSEKFVSAMGMSMEEVGASFELMMKKALDNALGHDGSRTSGGGVERRYDEFGHVLNNSDGPRRSNNGMNFNPGAVSDFTAKEKKDLAKILR